jgi:hypothetical protein
LELRPRGGNFIQIGTTEQTSALTGFQGQGSFRALQPGYEIFWSDTRVGFLPRPLGAVSAGTELSVSMSTTARGWELSARDSALHLQKELVVSVGGGLSYNLADCIQEEPAMGGDLEVDLPYALTSQVVFSDVVENGRRVDLPVGDAEALMPGNSDFVVPSKFHDDAFAMSNASSIQRQCLSDVRPYDYADYLYGIELAHWVESTPASREDVVRLFAVGAALLATSMIHQSWPPDIAGPIRRLYRLQQRQFAFLSAWLKENEGTGIDPPVFPSSGGSTIVASQVRYLLRLPRVAAWAGKRSETGEDELSSMHAIAPW